MRLNNPCFETCAFKVERSIWGRAKGGGGQTIPWNIYFVQETSFKQVHDHPLRFCISQCLLLPSPNLKWTSKGGYHIQIFHANKPECHISVDCICMNPMPQLVCYWISHMTLISKFKTSNWVQPCFSIYIACLNHNWYVLCKSTKSNRVKSNIVHKLHWIHSFGTLKLVDFKNVIAVHDYKKSAKMRTKLTWYLLTIVAYNAFLYIYGFLHMCIDWL